MTARRILSSVVAAILGISTSARGDVIRVEYGGVVTQAGISSGVAPGDRFSGSFTFDPAAPGNRFGIEGQSGYLYGDPGMPGSGPATTTLSAGNASFFNGNHLAIYLTQSDYAGQFSYADGTGKPFGPMSAVFFHSPVEGKQDDGVSLSLYNPTAAVLPSSAWDLKLPTTLDLADFPLATMTFAGPSSDSTQDFAGRVDTLRVVPEPATLALMGIVAALVVRRTRLGTHARLG